MRALLREDGKKVFTGIQEGDYLYYDPRTCCLSFCRPGANRLFINGDDKMFLPLRDPRSDSDIAKLISSVTGFSYRWATRADGVICWEFYQETPLW